MMGCWTCGTHLYSAPSCLSLAIHSDKSQPFSGPFASSAVQCVELAPGCLWIKLPGEFVWWYHRGSSPHLSHCSLSLCCPGKRDSPASCTMLALLASPHQPHSWEILVEMSTWQMEAVTSFHKNALLLRKWKLSEVWELNRVIGVCFNRSLVVTAQKFPSLSVPFSYTHNLQAIGELRWLNSLAEQMSNAVTCSAETSLKLQHLPAKQKWWAKK